MTDPDIRTLVRKARRERRVTRAKSCEVCGTPAHLRLGPDGRVLCYADVRAELGVGPLEVDHVAGRENLAGITVALLANDHRTVTEIRLRLGTDDWPAADGDPLLTLAHLLAGISTLLILVAEWLIDHALAVSEALGAPLVSRPFPVVP